MHNERQCNCNNVTFHCVGNQPAPSRLILLDHSSAFSGVALLRILMHLSMSIPSLASPPQDISVLFVIHVYLTGFNPPTVAPPHMICATQSPTSV